MAERSFVFIAGHVVPDLLNTVRWRLHPTRRQEDLVSYADLLGWAAQAELLGTAEQRALARLARTDPGRAEQELAALHDLREAAYAALVARDEQAVRDLVAGHRAALGRAELTAADGHWHWTEPELALSVPHDRLARAAIGLLTSPLAALLHQCEDDACGWVYLDTSPQRNRRWCVAADCGNRNRARAFYARTRARDRASAAPAGE